MKTKVLLLFLFFYFSFSSYSKDAIAPYSYDKSYVNVDTATYNNLLNIEKAYFAANMKLCDTQAQLHSVQKILVLLKLFLFLLVIIILVLTWLLVRKRI